MRKFLSFGLIFIICFLSLSGCSASKNFSVGTHKYIVSAIGFDKEKSDYTVYLEAVVINSEESGENSKRIIISGKSKRIAEAFKSAVTKAVEPIELGHCSSIIIGKGINRKSFKTTIDFLNSKRDINPAIQIVSAENASKLLKLEPIASVAMGFDLASMQQSVSKQFNIKYENRLYNLLSEKEIFLIPYFKFCDDGYCLENIRICKNGDNSFDFAVDLK